MRIVIASDIHGSARYCGKLLDAFRREDAEKLLLLGDLLYHGPRNDLPEGYAPKEVTAQLSACAPLILGVRGNCDAEIDQMVLPFPMMAEYCLLFVGGRTTRAGRRGRPSCSAAAGARLGWHTAAVGRVSS